MTQINHDSVNSPFNSVPQAQVPVPASHENVLIDPRPLFEEMALAPNLGAGTEKLQSSPAVIQRSEPSLEDVDVQQLDIDVKQEFEQAILEMNKNVHTLMGLWEIVEEVTHQGPEELKEELGQVIDTHNAVTSGEELSIAQVGLVIKEAEKRAQEDFDQITNDPKMLIAAYAVCEEMIKVLQTARLSPEQMSRLRGLDLARGMAQVDARQASVKLGPAGDLIQAGESLVPAIKASNASLTTLNETNEGMGSTHLTVDAKRFQMVEEASFTEVLEAGYDAGEFFGLEDVTQPLNQSEYVAPLPMKEAKAELKNDPVDIPLLLDGSELAGLTSTTKLQGQEVVKQRSGGSSWLLPALAITGVAIVALGTYYYMTSGDVENTPLVTNSTAVDELAQPIITLDNEMESSPVDTSHRIGPELKSERGPLMLGAEPVDTSYRIVPEKKGPLLLTAEDVKTRPDGPGWQEEKRWIKPSAEYHERFPWVSKTYERIGWTRNELAQNTRSRCQLDNPCKEGDCKDVSKNPFLVLAAGDESHSVENYMTVPRAAAPKTEAQLFTEQHERVMERMTLRPDKVVLHAAQDLAKVAGYAGNLLGYGLNFALNHGV